MQSHKARIVNRSSIVLAALAVVVGSQSALAVIKTWVGGSPSGNYFDVAGNWNTSGAPGAADTALFNLTGTYESVFDSITGNPTNAFLDVEVGTLAFRHDAGTLNTYTTGGMTVDNGAAFSLINLMKIVSTGDLNMNRGSSMTINILSTYQNNSTMRLGSGGTSAENKLIINNGGTVNANSVDLGEVAGTNARVTLSGTTAILNITNSLYAGLSGNGILEVTNGGKVTGDTAFLGYNIGGVGTATVTGTGSTWTNNYNLSLGDNTASGVGNLTISSGGRINVGDGAAAIPPDDYSYIDDTSANASAGGTLFVYNGSTLANNTTGLDIGNLSGHSGRVVVSGTNSTVNAGQFANIGNSGHGIVDISSGGSFITTVNTYLGFNSGGSGSVTIDGNTSKLWAKNDLHIGDAGFGSGTLTTTNGGSLYVGDAANAAGLANGVIYVSDTSAPGSNLGGTLTIANGSTLTHNGVAYVGLFAGQTGRVVVTGTNSLWTNSGDIYLGSGSDPAAHGELQVDSSAIIHTFRLFADGANSPIAVQSGGRIETTTQGVLGTFSGQSGTATVTGTNSTLAVGTTLEVGRAGTGTLNINSAGNVSAVTAILGTSATGVGNVTLTGTNSLMNVTGDLTVGQSGTGTFTTSSSANLHVGDGTLTGIGTAVAIVSDTNAGGASGGNLKIANGSTFNHNSGSWIVMGFASGEWGKMTVTGTNSTFTGNTDVVVGRSGTGVLDINTGGRVTANGSVTAGLFAGGTGTITIDGTNSLLISKNDLTLDKGSTLTTSNSGGLQIGDNTSGFAGDRLVVGDNNTIASNSGGKLTITGGSVLTHQALAHIAPLSGTTGSVWVTGANSKWILGNNLFMGNNGGSGELHIESGGYVSTAFQTVIGNASPSNSIVTVTGTNSQLVCSTALEVGRAGTGTLNITSAGKVTASSLILGNVGGGSGTININNAGSLLQVNGNINNGSAGTGQIVVDGGTLTQTGTSTLYMGSSTGPCYLYLLSSGSTVTTGSAGSNISSNGNIQMSGGTFTTTTLQNNGLVNASPGTININGATGTGNIQLFNATLNSTNKGIVQDTMNIAGTSTVTIGANGSSTGVSKIKSLTIGANGKLELRNNDLIVDYTGGSSPYTTVRNKVMSGLALLGGTGKGIASSEVDAQTIPSTLLAVVDNGAIGGQITQTSGASVPANSVVVKYTWFGDSNLDGAVDGSDYALLDTGFTSGGSLTGWVFGDYDYNNTIDGADYAIIDSGFIQQVGVLPEPGMLGLLGLSTILIGRRISRVLR